MMTKITPYGTLEKTGNIYKTKNSKPYDCEWLEKNTVRYRKFVMSKFYGTIIGNNQIIHQSITNTNCFVYKQYCKPSEQKRAVLVWKKTKHDFALYHNLGIYDIYRIGDFYLINSLGIGGAKLRTSGTSILLDNTYVLETDIIEHNTSKRNENFTKFAEQYAGKTKSNIQRDLLEGRLSKELILEHQIMSTMTAMLCNMRKDISNLHKLLMHSFTDVVDELMMDSKGHIIENAGEAIIIKKCRMVSYKKIAWNQKLNDTCYMYFPIMLQSGTINFLELITRRIYAESPTIDCNKRPSEIYVRDSHNKFWKFNNETGFSRTKIQYQQYGSKRLTMQKLNGFNEKLAHYSKPKTHRNTILSIIAEEQDSLKEITDFKTKGKGSFINGIFSGVADSVNSLSDTSRTILHSIAVGLKHITNDTVEIAVETTDTIEGFFNILKGGPSSLVLYVIDLLIIGYLIYERLIQNRPPPLPPRNL